jgi:hypothetical protein
MDVGSTESRLVKKLRIKPGDRVWVVNAPDGYLRRLEPLPDGAEIVTAAGGKCEVVHVFVRDTAELDRHASAAREALKPGGVLWFSYPKRQKGVDTDINRDQGWDPLKREGLVAVTQIAIDDLWSALRFRPEPEVGR